MAQAISNLPIGAKVKDPAWTWEHRTGNGYTGSGEIKPITWLIIAKNHSGYPSNSITLLSEEVIAKHIYDNSQTRDGSFGYGVAHWGRTGVPDATRGLRKFLNGSSYAGDDTNTYADTLYDKMAAYLRSVILPTTVVNKANASHSWQTYTTIDNIFVPSPRELGIADSKYQVIGTDYGFFTTNALRQAKLAGANTSYWTRGTRTDSQVNYGVSINTSGAAPSNIVNSVINNFVGVRPVINVANTTIVSSAPDSEGAYLVGGDPFPAMQVAINGVMCNIVDGYVGINGANRRISGAIVGINGVNKEV